MKGIRFCKKSKFCKYYSELDNLSENRLINYLRKLHRFHGSLLIPVSDQYLISLAKNYDIIERLFVPSFPKYDTIIKLSNKAELYKSIKSYAPVPRTVIVDDSSTIKKIAKENIYPSIIKPSDSVKGHYLFQQTGIKCVLVQSKEDLLRKYKWILKYDSRPIIQEYIPGPPSNVYSFCAVIDKKRRFRAIFTGRKIRQDPLDFGRATIAESTWTPQIIRHSLKILKKSQYYGIVEIEFKYDYRDNEYKVLEINPRIWTWIGITRACGIDFPWILYSTFMRTEIKSEYPSHKSDNRSVRWISMSRDINLLKKCIKSRNISLKNLCTWFSPWCTNEISEASLSFSDILPNVEIFRRALMKWIR